MKRILVVDESQAVRETLALILGRQFVVEQRSSLPADVLTLAHADPDLLVLGMSPAFGDEATLLKIAGEVSSPVLFLVDTQPGPNFSGREGAFDCLVKPFNPYELRERVDRLLARTRARVAPTSPPHPAPSKNGRYLEHPYIPAPLSALAKRYARTPLSIHIIGESGCGQGRLARAFHELSGRAGSWLSTHARAVSRDHLQAEMSELRKREGEAPRRVTLFVSGLESLDPSGQSSLLLFLQAEEEKGAEFRLLSSSKVDLLEKVYRGEFLDELYYRLATLLLRLPPLRERQDDLPALAARLAEEYGRGLNLGKVTLSAAALDRLSHYLWFGNVDELEAVIARTIAAHGRQVIDAPDIRFGGDEWAEQSPAVEQKPGGKRARESSASTSLPAVPGFGNGDKAEMKILLTELAHELKNPMVTIKTFAQLLRERFDDEAFRVQFQEAVSGDIKRMDDLLEAMLDFSRFSRPAVEPIPLYRQLRRIEEELLPDCIKREASFHWGKKGEEVVVLADRDQFLYAFKTLLAAVLGQVRPHSEIQIDVEKAGKVALSYLRDGERMSGLARYLDLAASSEESGAPLSILFAKILLERNRGELKIRQLDGARVLVQAELPVA